jgi:hypothetical protein
VNYRSFAFRSIILAGALLVLTGCIQQVDRPGVSFSGPTATPTLAPTLTPTATPPVPTPTPIPTRIPAPADTPEPVTKPTPTPTPTPERPLFVQFLEPAFGSTVRDETITVVGLTKAGAAVRINDIPAEVDAGGNFQGEATLTPGANVIEVLATGSNGERVRGFVTVTYVQPPPEPLFLLVNEPLDQIIIADQPIRVAGQTVPRAIVHVNGVGIPVDNDGEFSTLMQLREGVNEIDIWAFADGRSVTTVRTVTYSPS